MRKSLGVFKTTYSSTKICWIRSIENIFEILKKGKTKLGSKASNLEAIKFLLNFEKCRNTVIMKSFITILLIIMQNYWSNQLLETMKYRERHVLVLAQDFRLFQDILHLRFSNILPIPCCQIQLLWTQWRWLRIRICLESISSDLCSAVSTFISKSYSEKSFSRKFVPSNSSCFLFPKHFLRFWQGFTVYWNMTFVPFPSPPINRYPTSLNKGLLFSKGFHNSPPQIPTKHQFESPP